MSKRDLKPNQQILEEASSWFIDLNDGTGEPDEATREEFNTWLRRSPEHLQAFLQMSALMEGAGRLKKSSIDIEELIARAKQEDNVFPLALGGGRDASGVQSKKVLRTGASDVWGPFRLFTIAATFLLVLCITVSAWFYTQRNVYATQIGEQRSITLEDGSFVELNSKSRVRVSYREKERQLELFEGQALFKVAKNTARPFIVRTGDTSVRAVGTQFDVYSKTSGTVVTVIEGKVAVGSGTGPVEGSAGKPAGEAGMTPAPGEVLLAAGEQLTMAPRRAHKPRSVPDAAVSGTVAAAAGASVPKPKPVDVQAATAWTEQKLVFQETRLRDVVDEFNRYNRDQLTVNDPALGDYQITGTFPTADPNRMLEFLRLRFHVTISRSGHQVEIDRAE